jgi:hypothetical protein
VHGRSIRKVCSAFRIRRTGRHDNSGNRKRRRSRPHELSRGVLMGFNLLEQEPRDGGLRIRPRQPSTPHPVPQVEPRGAPCCLRMLRIGEAICRYADSPNGSRSLGTRNPAGLWRPNLEEDGGATPCIPGPSGRGKHGSRHDVPQQRAGRSTSIQATCFARRRISR